jgi:hypothetical protein
MVHNPPACPPSSIHTDNEYRLGIVHGDNENKKKFKDAS